VGSGGRSGMVTEIFRLDNLESEVFGGACEAPERSGVSKNVWNK